MSNTAQKMNPSQDPKRVVTGQVRLSYVHLLKPRAQQQGGEPKYSVTLLIPKSDVVTYQKLQAAIQAAIEDAVSSKWNGVRPANIPVPIHDGDGLKQSGEPFPDECKGHWVMTASSTQKPEVVDLNLNPILDASQVYSGMYARVSVRFFGYNQAGKKGIGAGLGNVQKLADGEPLSGSVSAKKDFGPEAAPWNPPAYPKPQQNYAPASPAYQQPAYQQPVYPQPQYPQAQYPQPGYSQQAPRQQAAPQIDPITGRPTGGIMGVPNDDLPF